MRRRQRAAIAGVAARAVAAAKEVADMAARAAATGEEAAAAATASVTGWVRGAVNLRPSRTEQVTLGSCERGEQRHLIEVLRCRREKTQEQRTTDERRR